VISRAEPVILHRIEPSDARAADPKMEDVGGQLTVTEAPYPSP
jgi:hypothetical protein